MSLSSVTITMGDSLDFQFRYSDNRVLTDYTCQLQVRDSSDVITGIDRAITDYGTGDTKFIGRLTPAETNALAVGTYTISGQLAYAAIDEALELNGTLIITKQFNF